MKSLRILSVSIGTLVFLLLNVLTVESHPYDQGNVASQCPTVVDYGLEFAVDEGLHSGLDVIHLVSHPVYQEAALIPNSSHVSSNVSRSPPHSSLHP